MKNYLALFLLMLSSTLFAQDVIVKKDGSTILSKVYEIGKKEIKYKKFSNLNGPIYNISIKEVLSVNYENGEKDLFDKIEEIEEERQYYDGKPGMIDYLNWFGRIVSASRIAPYC